MNQWLIYKHTSIKSGKSYNGWKHLKQKESNE